MFAVEGFMPIHRSSDAAGLRRSNRASTSAEIFGPLKTPRHSPTRREGGSFAARRDRAGLELVAACVFVSFCDNRMRNATAVQLAGR